MLTLLKLLQSLFKTLHSEGTPGQVAAGIMLGAGIGLTPILSAHNLVLFAAIVLLNVSFGGGMLGMAVFTPVAFLLDPLFDRMGLALLEAPGQGLWTDWYNIPLTDTSNNSVTLSSFTFWLVSTVPLYFLAKWGIARYRATYGQQVMNSGLKAQGLQGVQRLQLVPARMSETRFRVFRWKAVGPLLLFFVILVVLWIIFADRIVRGQAESNLSATLGTQVDIASLRIREADAAVDIGGLAIADPRDRMRNLVEAGAITIDLDPVLPPKRS
jgi:uncharacterized protein (TIGR03546 family)